MSSNQHGPSRLDDSQDESELVGEYEDSEILQPNIKATKVELPFYKQLHFRLAFILALMLIIFELISDPILRFGYHNVAPTFKAEERTSVSQLANKIEDSLQTLLPNEQVNPLLWSPKWRLSHEILQGISKELRLELQCFVCLDQNSRVIVASPDLAMGPGEEWGHEFGPKAVVYEGARTLAKAKLYYQPLASESKLIGSLVLLRFDASLLGELSSIENPDSLRIGLAATSDLANEAYLRERALEYQPTISHATVEIIVQWSILALAAVIIALLVSRWVTRPLQILLSQLRASDGQKVPGPFSCDASSEIAILASSLTDMRNRLLKVLDRLESRDHLRRQWIAQVAHDLRTPLTALVACLNRAESTMLEEGAKITDISEILSVAGLDAERIRVMTEDLLDIALLDIEDSLNIELLPPGELVRGAVRSLKPLAEYHGLELETDFAVGLPALHADGHRLLRACENLLRNGIQHARNKVTICIEQDLTGLTFMVLDDGDGFEDADGEVKIEEIESQRRDDSAGLGLQLTARTAQAHGGRLAASNRPEGGASVWFHIPFKAGEL